MGVTVGCVDVCPVSSCSLRLFYPALLSRRMSSKTGSMTRFFRFPMPFRIVQCLQGHLLPKGKEQLKRIIGLSGEQPAGSSENVTVQPLTPMTGILPVPSKKLLKTIINLTSHHYGLLFKGESYISRVVRKRTIWVVGLSSLPCPCPMSSWQLPRFATIL